MGDTQLFSYGYLLVVIGILAYIIEAPVNPCINTQGSYQEAEEICPGDVCPGDVFFFRYTRKDSLGCQDLDRSVTQPKKASSAMAVTG